MKTQAQKKLQMVNNPSVQLWVSKSLNKNTKPKFNDSSLTGIGETSPSIPGGFGVYDLSYVCRHLIQQMEETETEFSTQLDLPAIKRFTEILFNLKDWLNHCENSSFSQLMVRNVVMGSMNHRFLKDLRHVMEQNLENSGFGMDQMAQELCMSKSNLYRKTVEITGSGPNTLFRSVRLNRARILLKQQAGSVKEIAYRCGFNNLSYFAKCYKSMFEVLPSET
jgi:AraC-like DNA-binding protein